MIIPVLEAELKHDEDVKYVLYIDTEGIPSTGVGHNLQASPLPAGWKFPLTDLQVSQLLTSDLAETFFQLDKNIPWWRNLSEVRQRVVANMCFNLGIIRFLGFSNTLTFIKAGNYAHAAINMRASKWATQVKGRAIRLATAMETNVMPPLN